MRRPILVAFALALSLHPANGEERKSISQYAHTSWTAKDGIPGPVRAIAQTPDGYLWLGTEAGLYLFDGRRFTPADSILGPALASSRVTSLFVAHGGDLWVGFGTSRISRVRDGEVKSYGIDDGVPAGAILSIVEDGDAKIWASGPYGLVRFERGKWHRAGRESGYLAPAAQSMKVDANGILWVATDGLDFRFSTDPVRSNTIVRLAPKTTMFSGTGEGVGEVWSMSVLPGGRVWFADTSGHAIRAVESSTPPIALADETLCMLSADDGSIWVGLIADGLRRIDPAAPEKADHFTVANGLSGSIIYTAFKDREGNLWFGTSLGLDRFHENKVMPITAREGLLPDEQIAVQSGGVGGIWVFSYTRDTIRRIHDRMIDTFKLPRYSPGDTTRILSMHEEPGTSLLLGGSFGVATEKGQAFSFLTAPGYPGGWVEAIARDRTGAPWIAVTNANRKGRVMRLERGGWTDVSADLPPYRCRTMFREPSGRMWLGFENGMVASFEGSAMKLYSSKDGLPPGRIFVIQGDRDGTIWVGGEGGLSRLRGNRFEFISNANGLPGTSVSGIVEDANSFLWLACSLAIVRVDPREIDKALARPSYRMRMTAFGAGDGLPGLPRQSEPFPTATPAADGRLWFATTGGIAVIDPTHWVTNRVPPPVKIVSVIADGRLYSSPKDLELPALTKNLTFRYTALSLTDPERVRFRYKLDGYDEQWRGPTDDREVNYTNLAPRRYSFHVIACNNDGVWNEQGAAVQMTLLPAFYQTQWFLYLAIITAMLVAWSIHKWRMRLAAAQLDLQFRERLAERTRIAQDLHDNLLQGVVSASMQLHVAFDELPADSRARSRLQRVAELLGQFSERGRDAVRGLRTSNADVDLAQAFSRIPAEAQMSQPESFRVIVEGTARPLHPLVRDEIYHVGREALMNALRHARASAIEVEIEYLPAQLRVLIRDDGAGIDDEAVRLGAADHWGLAGMRERATRMGASLRVWSRTGGGTEVELAVPATIAFEGHPPSRLRRWFGRTGAVT